MLLAVTLCGHAVGPDAIIVVVLLALTLSLLALTLSLPVLLSSSHPEQCILK